MKSNFSLCDIADIFKVVIMGNYIKFVYKSHPFKGKSIKVE